MEFGYRNRVVFFQSDTTGLGPPFEWRDQESFRNLLNTVTKGIFRRMDFTHASLAGHFILSLLQLPPSDHDNEKDWEILELPDYFSVEDLDVYVHGDFDFEEERIKLATDIVDGILLCCSEEESGLFETPPAVEQFPEKFRIVIKGMPAINIFPDYKPDRLDMGSFTLDPFPPLSLAQLLHSFDIDSYCWAYDGSRVVATLRGIRAACSRMNVANPNYKFSLNYEDRLADCWRRGYNIAIPNATTKHLHRNKPRFLTHSIDIPRLYNLSYPEDKVGGDGDPGYRPPSRDLSPWRPATGFFC
ncbi:hypothetical protein Ndes2526B_g00728 [Nannochloris sp. 'desiccata']